MKITLFITLCITPFLYSCEEWDQDMPSSYHGISSSWYDTVYDLYQKLGGDSNKLLQNSRKQQNPQQYIFNELFIKNEDNDRKAFPLCSIDAWQSFNLLESLINVSYDQQGNSLFQEQWQQKSYYRVLLYSFFDLLDKNNKEHIKEALPRFHTAVKKYFSIDPVHCTVSFKKFEELFDGIACLTDEKLHCLKILHVLDKEYTSKLIIKIKEKYSCDFEKYNFYSIEE